MNDLRLHCANPECGRTLRVPAAASGRRIRCPSCKQEMRVPGSSDERCAPQELCHLYVLKGPVSTSIDIELQPDRPYTFGHASTCTVPLPGASIARRQFSLHWVHDHWVLKDLQSDAGTCVNGVAVDRKELCGGEIIQAGDYQLKFFKPAARPDRKHGRTTEVALSDAAVAPSDPFARPGEEVAEPDPRLAQQRLVEALDSAGSAGNVSEAETHERAGGHVSPSICRAAVLVIAIVVGLGWFGARGVNWYRTLVAVSPIVDEPNNVRLTPAPALPQDFTSAVAALDFELARRVLETAGNDATAQAMQDYLAAAIGSFREDLLQQARAASRAQEWDEVDRIMAAASDPVLGELSEDWRPVQDALDQHRQHVAATESSPESQPTAGTRPRPVPAAQPSRSVTPAEDDPQRAGLRVDLLSGVDDVRIALDGQAVAAGRAVWQLQPGSATLLASAPGFIDHSQSVTLETGKLLTVEIKLLRKPPPALLALLSLQRTGPAEPLWVAAQYYSDSGALHATLVDRFTSEAERKLARQPGRTTLRVARVTPKEGEAFLARVWTDSAGRLGVSRLPSGVREVLSVEDLATVQDLELDAAADAAFQTIRAARTGGLSALETLKLIAKWRVDLGADNQTLATRICHDTVAECLQDVEAACDCCAGATRIDCPRCDGSGHVLRSSACDRCKGSKKLNCAECNGQGSTMCRTCSGRGSVEQRQRQQERCETCGGTGSVPGGRGGRDTCSWCGGSGWVWRTRTVSIHCVTCGGKGEITCTRCKGAAKLDCPKCKGTGRIEERTRCQVCDKGTLVCDCCQGIGTRAALSEAHRREWEQQAAALMGE